MCKLKYVKLWGNLLKIKYILSVKPKQFKKTLESLHFPVRLSYAHPSENSSERHKAGSEKWFIIFCFAFPFLYSSLTNLNKIHIYQSFYYLFLYQLNIQTHLIDWWIFSLLYYCDSFTTDILHVIDDHTL